MLGFAISLLAAGKCCIARHRIIADFLDQAYTTSLVTLPIGSAALAKTIAILQIVLTSRLATELHTQHPGQLQKQMQTLALASLIHMSR